MPQLYNNKCDQPEPYGHNNQDIEQFLASIYRYIQLGVYIRGYQDKVTRRFVREIAEVTEFYVTKDNAINFLEEKLTILGLNAKERNEFIMYWLPVLEKNEKSLVYFEQTTKRENFNKLLIEPKPDSLLRIAIHIKKVDKEIKITNNNCLGFIATVLNKVPPK